MKTTVNECVRSCGETNVGQRYRTGNCSTHHPRSETGTSAHAVMFCCSGEGERFRWDEVDPSSGIPRKFSLTTLLRLRADTSDQCRRTVQHAYDNSHMQATCPKHRLSPTSSTVVPGRLFETAHWSSEYFHAYAPSKPSPPGALFFASTNLELYTRRLVCISHH